MPLPTFNASKEEAAKELSQRAVLLKRDCVRYRNMLSNDDVGADLPLREILRVLIVARDHLARLAARAGGAAFYADLTGRTQAQIEAGFAELQQALVGGINWIVANVPKAISGGVQCVAVETIDAQGALAYRMLSPAQTAGLRTALSAIEAAILDPT